MSQICLNPYTDYPYQSKTHFNFFISAHRQGGVDNHHHVPCSLSLWIVESQYCVRSVRKCGNPSENYFTYDSTGNACPQSSQFTEPLWTDPWPKEWNRYMWANRPPPPHPTKMHRQGQICQTFIIPKHEEKATTTSQQLTHNSSPTR